MPKNMIRPQIRIICMTGSEMNMVRKRTKNKNYLYNGFSKSMITPWKLIICMAGRQMNVVRLRSICVTGPKMNMANYEGGSFITIYNFQ